MLDYALKEGIEQSIEKGMQQGKLEEAKEIAREMKKDGLPLLRISKFTKLSIEEIEKL